MAADALLTDLFKQLASISVQLAKQEIKLLAGVDEEVQKLEDKLEDIKTMLDDADKRHAVKLDNEKRWLKKLQDKYYEMDDVLDTWSTARIKGEIEKEEGKPADAPAVVKKKVCSFFPSPSCCFNLQLRHDLGYKIKRLNEKLDEIFNDKEKYGIDFNRQPEIVVRPITTSFVDEADIIGRDNYRDELLSNLLGVGCTKERKPHVISLVGMGGLGKTTLAQIAYNHSEVKAHFGKRMWVCVSDPFDQCKVAKAIIESLEGQSPNATELQSLLDKLFSLIGGKRFFLVLDDVWIEDFTKWEPFRNALKCGAEGSRILVTTRKTRVANMMESCSIIDLGVLSSNDCWLIIQKIAFPNDYGEQYRDLEELGKQLANKCKGLPLAAKILGGYIRGKINKKELEKVLHNDLWELEDIDNGLLGPFFLSYYELSSSEKQCFLFCAVFPKDYRFNKFDLIINWMAQGYINSKENMEMEDRAEHCFENLAMCSFFQDFEKDDNDGKIVSCKMHDIVHDFAESMAKDVCFKINYSGDKVEKDFKRARQLSLIVEETFPESVYKAKNLHFLNLDFISSSIVQPKLFDHLTCLRTLHLEGESILELPNEVEKLIHLRLLKFTCREIKELPESICNLCNLQSLDVSECRELEKLPQGIGKLINLRHLLFGEDLEEFGIKSFPKGIGRLTCLKTLTYFPVGGKAEEICKLGELEHLNHLRDLKLLFRKSKEMEEEERRRREMEKDVAILNALEPPPRLESLLIRDYKGTTMYPNWIMSKLTYLKRLSLSWCLNLEQLPPLGKLPLLEELQIKGLYNVGKVGDEFLGIDIEEELSESSKNNNNKDIIIFPNLKSLKFESLTDWEEWTGIGGTIEEEKEKDNSANAFVTNNTPKSKIMPLLHFLHIGRCGNLMSLPDYLRNTPLQDLEIEVCPILEQHCERGIGDYWPNISHIPNIRIPFPKGIGRLTCLKLVLHFDSVKEMFDCSEVEDEEETKEERRRRMEKDVAFLNALEPPPRLESLYIYSYKGTTMYPNWMMSKLTYLKILVLDYCPNLEPLPPLVKLPLLEELGIKCTPMIRKVGDEFLGIDIEEEELSKSSKNNNNKDIIIFPNLKSLFFWGLPKWEEWTGMGGTIEEKDNSANAFVTNNTPKIKIMPLLHSLTIEFCFNLKSLPDYLRNTPLKKLEITLCPILKQHCERGIGDHWPNISHIPNIQIDNVYVQRDGQFPDSIDSERCEHYYHRGQLEGSNGAGFETDEEDDEEAPEAANAEDSDEDDSFIRTFTTARLDAANAGGGSGLAQDGESELLRHG